MSNKVYEIVDCNEKLLEAIARVRKAQQTFATYTQEQVDKIFLAAASAANKARIPLAKLAVEETGMGIVEDKVIKNNYAAEYIYNAYKDTKTCGVIEEDKTYGIKKIAEPIGVVAAVIPTTNPTSTAIFKTLISLKTRNGIIISPHPRAKNATIAAAKLVLEAAVAAGAPEGIIDWIDVPSLEMTNTVMREADIILATGGPSMVKAAYSSGKPALGVGAGNTPAIIDDSADILLAVNSIIHSKTFDNGMICASEQSVLVMENIYEEVKKEFATRGCYFLNADEIEKVRKTILINGALNANIVGQKAAKIAELAGVEVPSATKILIGEVESVDISEEFAHEKLSPVLAMYKAKENSGSDNPEVWIPVFIKIMEEYDKVLKQRKLKENEMNQLDILSIQIIASYMNRIEDVKQLVEVNKKYNQAIKTTRYPTLISYSNDFSILFPNVTSVIIDNESIQKLGSSIWQKRLININSIDLDADCNISLLIFVPVKKLYNIPKIKKVAKM